MALTPTDVHNIEFGKAAIGKRGYHQEEVDALLDEATLEMIRLREENDALRSRLDHDDPAPPTRAADSQIAQLSAELARADRACDAAEHTAWRVRQQLDEAHRRGPVAEQPRSDAVLAMAQRTADGYLDQAQRTSSELLTEAHHRSERVIGEARRLVTEIEQNAQRRAGDAETVLASQRAGLRRDIADLTRFAEHYHAALAGSVHRQGDLIAGTGTSV